MSSIFDGMAEVFRDVLGDDELLPYTHADVTVGIRGIFDTPTVAVDGISEIQIIDADTWLHVAEADLPAGYGENDTVVVRGVTYRAKTPMPDGRGMVRIPLLRA